MGDIEQLTQEEVNKIVKDFPVQPTFNGVIMTVNMDEDDNGLVLSDAGLSEVQYVIAAGPACRIEAGSKVIIDFKKLLVREPVKTDQTKFEEKIHVDTIVVDDRGYAFVTDRVIKAIDYRED